MARYSPVVALAPNGDPGITGAGGDVGESEDARWVRSFLLSQPGKTFRIEQGDDAREAAATEAVAAAAQSLTDEVVRGAGPEGTSDATSQTEPC